MRTKWTLAMLGLMVAVLVVSCGGEQDRVIVRITDDEGVASPREITVAYVNDRMDGMPPHLVPDVPGEEGKRQFVEEIIQKELLVIKAERLGIDEEPTIDQLRELYGEEKARSMFLAEHVYGTGEMSMEQIEEYNILRETMVGVQQIVVRADEESAWDAYSRVTEGGEDFAAVARDVSVAASAEGGGTMPGKVLPDLHPVIAANVVDRDVREVTEPIVIGGAWHIYKVISRKAPPEPPELDEGRLAGVKSEARVWHKTINEYRFNEKMRADSEVQYNDEALAVASERVQEVLDEIIPENVEELPTQERMKIAHTKVIPEFTEDELGMQLVSFKIGPEEHTWTLGDLKRIMEETPGIETPKDSDPYRLQLFIWRNISSDTIDYLVSLEGYESTQEYKDYIDMRVEEYLVNSVYNREVVEKIEQPSGQEIRDRFRNNREDYAEPPKVDIQQLIVANEADANMIRQRIMAGEATFEEMVEKYSIDEWSKPRGGSIKGYGQGERKLAYLQDFVFDMEEGEISTPQPSTGGFVIVKLNKKYPRRLMEFSELGDLVKQQIVAERTEARLKEVLDEVRETSTIEWTEENLQYVKDPAEAVAEKRADRFVVTS